MKYFSLFSGIGGFELGIEKDWQYLQKQRSSRTNIQPERNIADFDSSQKRRQGSDAHNLRPVQQESSEKSETKYDLANKLGRWECVGYSEIDKYAIQIYKKHFPTHKNYGDATRIDTKQLPSFDILVAGFPCQAFSIAGKRQGFQDIRGTLFFEIARICRDKRPRYILLENVKGLLSHESGKTFQAILKVLSDIGYILQWEVLNSKNYGVPQNRERVFIVGHIRGESRPEVFPITGNSKESNLQYVGAILSEKNQKWLQDGKELSRNFPQGQRVYSTKGTASSICGRAGGLGGKTGLYQTAPCLNSSDSRKHYSGQHRQFYKQTGLIRRLTPTECERLQGFPDGWTEGISDTQRYKCLGNAVTVNVIKEIICHINV